MVDMCKKIDGKMEDFTREPGSKKHLSTNSETEKYKV
jgi:hypothetical protein